MACTMFFSADSLREQILDEHVARLPGIPRVAWTALKVQIFVACLKGRLAHSGRSLAVEELVSEQQRTRPCRFSKSCVILSLVVGCPRPVPYLEDARRFQFVHVKMQ